MFSLQVEPSLHNKLAAFRLTAAECWKYSMSNVRETLRDDRNQIGAESLTDRSSILFKASSFPESLSPAHEGFYLHLLHFIHSTFHRCRDWVQNVQKDINTNDKGFSCPTGLPFKANKTFLRLQPPSLCISHIFNNYLLVTAATLNICALNWCESLVQRTCNHMTLTQLPCTTKLCSFLHVIWCYILIQSVMSW